jgi:hypothetical protein
LFYVKREFTVHSYSIDEPGEKRKEILSLFGGAKTPLIPLYERGTRPTLISFVPINWDSRMTVVTRVQGRDRLLPIPFASLEGLGSG